MSIPDWKATSWPTNDDRLRSLVGINQRIECPYCGGHIDLIASFTADDREYVVEPVFQVEVHAT